MLEMRGQIIIELIVYHKEVPKEFITGPRDPKEYYFFEVSSIFGLFNINIKKSYAEYVKQWNHKTKWKARAYNY